MLHKNTKLGMNAFKFSTSLLFNSNHATFDVFAFKKPAAVAVFISVSNLVRLETVCERIFFSEQSAHSLVRGLSDFVNSLAGFLIAIFILKKSREHSQYLDTLFKFDNSIYSPIKIYLLTFFFELLVLSLNILTFLVEQNQFLYHLSCIATDFFIIAMDAQIIFDQYILFACFKMLNIKIATQALNDQIVAHLRLSHSKIISISEKFHQMYDAVSLSLIATHSFYFQIDLFYLISSLYNLQVQDKLQVGDKNYLVEYVLWSFVNFASTILIFLGFSKVEIEVILLVYFLISYTVRFYDITVGLHKIIL